MQSISSALEKEYLRDISKEAKIVPKHSGKRDTPLSFNTVMRIQKHKEHCLV